MAPRALVTGASGFVGKRLVKLLCDRGWEVQGLVPPAERDAPISDARMRVVIGDITDPASLRGKMEGMDAVFHLAALVLPWLRDPREYARVNVAGTENVIDEALRARVSRFIFTSSLSGIGVRPGEIVREDSPPGKVFGEYEQSKADAERRVHTAVRERGLPAVVLIPGIVIGPGDLRNTGAFLLEFARGNFPGTFAEDSPLPVVDVDDLARAHLLAFERGKVGSRYIICGENATWGSLLRMTSEVSGTPVPTRHYGARAVWLATRAGEIRARLGRKEPQFPAWLADFMLMGARMDHTKSVEELGMAYTPISRSIHGAMEWFRDEGLLVRRPEPRAQLPPGVVENPLEGAGTERGLPASPEDRAPQPRRPKPPEGPKD